jgi:hypothetical protein
LNPTCTFVFKNPLKMYVFLPIAVFIFFKRDKDSVSDFKHGV